jgi:hypothetical protein
MTFGGPQGGSGRTVRRPRLFPAAAPCSGPCVTGITVTRPVPLDGLVGASFGAGGAFSRLGLSRPSRAAESQSDRRCQQQQDRECGQAGKWADMPSETGPEEPRQRPGVADERHQEDGGRQGYHQHVACDRAGAGGACRPAGSCAGTPACGTLAGFQEGIRAVLQLWRAGWENGIAIRPQTDRAAAPRNHGSRNPPRPM